MEVNGEALQLHSAYKSRIFTASHVRIHISTTSHVRIRIRYCKSRALCLNMQWKSTVKDVKLENGISVNV